MSDHHHHHHDAELEDAALLKYMKDHNAHHAEELRVLASHLREHGNESAAAAIEEAVASFEEGNVSLEKALMALEE